MKICQSLSDKHNISISLSWLLQYLGKTYDNEFMLTALKLGYPIVRDKMDKITAAAMWQESNVSKKSQRVILRYFSNFFGSRLVVPEHCIDELGTKSY